MLSDCISCVVTEELNSVFEATIEYPIDERGKWQYLLEGNIAKIGDQLYRIYHKVKKLTSISVNLRHIYYDLLDNFLEDITLTNINGAGALDAILTNTQYAHSFTSMSDVSILANTQFVRKNVVESIMGTDGLINNIGGELVRDNYTIKLLGARGLDRGVLVSYGKNVQGIEETLDTDGICTRLMPVGKDGLLLTEKYIDSPYINNFSHPKIKVIELSDYEAVNPLRVAGQEYMTNNKIDIPQFNYKINFISLKCTEEYKNYAVLERVYLGDTVTIKHSKLGINLKAKVIKITKNILTDRIEKIELGSFKPNLATTINNSIQEVKKDIVQVKSDYQKAIDNATKLITGSEGGNVVIRQDEAGKPYEILIMDTADVNTALDVWRWNMGGFGHSSTGINGPYDTAITQDGSIVADYITTGILNANLIKTGLLQSINGETEINMTDGTFNFADDGIIYDGVSLTLGSGTSIISPNIFGGLLQGTAIQQVSGATIFAEFTVDANGGILDINDMNGNPNVRIGSETGGGDNVGGTIGLYNDSLASKRVGIGIDSSYDAGIINLSDSADDVKIALYADGTSGAGIFVLNSVGSVRSYLTEIGGKINYDDIATENWVDNNYGGAIQPDGQYIYLPNGCYLECLTNRLILHANAGSYLDIRDTGTWVYAKDGTSKQL